MCAVNRRQSSGRATASRFTGDAEWQKAAHFIDVPVFDAQRTFVFKTGGLSLFNNQRPDQTATELFAAVDVRVIPITASIGHTEFVIEVFAMRRST